MSCQQDTTTTDTTNQNGAQRVSNSRNQRFSNGQPITADVAAGVRLDGAGLALSQAHGRGRTQQAISLTNAGSITADRPGTVTLVGNGGAISYSGSGSVSSSNGVAIFAQNGGGLTIVADGAVRSGTPLDKRVTPPAVRLYETGAGNIVFDGAGSVTAPAGRGIKVDQGPEGTGSLRVSGTGDTAGLGEICPGVPDRVTKTGKTGCSGIRATIKNAANRRDIVVDRSGNITGTSTAINAQTFGKGNIAIRTGQAAQVVGVSEFGIEASSKGNRSRGSIAIATGSAGTLTSGGNGIFATNLASDIPVGARSTIEIDAAGRINSGTFRYAALNPKNPTGVLAGISAGYVGGQTAAPNAAVHGTVIINNAAVITAYGGAGILGYNFGSGAIRITNTADVTAMAGTGIDTRSFRGQTSVAVTGGSTVTGTRPGNAALNAETEGGLVGVSVDAGARLRGAEGAGGIVLTGAKARNKATIRNAGTIAGGDAPPSRPGDPPRFSQGGVGIKGASLVLSNSGAVTGGADADGSRAYAISFTGGANQVGGPGAIVGGINVTATSSFMPALSGNDVGTPLVVDGPLRFASTATYRIRVTRTVADATTVTGAATLNGATVHAETGGMPPPTGTTYTILTATQGVMGRFSAVTSDLAFFHPTLAYSPDAVTLTSRYDYRLTDGTRNETSVGTGLNAAAAQRNEAARPIFRALKQVPTANGAAVLDSLSGEGITAAQNIAHRSAELFTSTVVDQTLLYGSAANSFVLTEPVRELADLPANAAQPIAPIPSNRTWRVWSAGFGGVEDVQGHAGIGSASQQNTIFGGALGIDRQVTQNYLVGVAVGGSDGAFRVPGRATSGSSTGGHVAIYDLATFGGFYGASSTSFSYYSNRSARTVTGFGGLGNETERGDFASNEVRTRVEFGRSFSRAFGLGHATVVTPFVALELAELRSNGFRETPVSGPGNFGLAVAGQSTASAPAFLGLRLQSSTSIGNGLVLSPALQLAYIHEFAPYRSQIATIAALPGATFLVDGARPSRDAAQIKGGVELAIGPRSVFFVNFDGEFASGNQLYAGKGGFAYFW